jgi:transcription antitermination factor NusG
MRSSSQCGELDFLQKIAFNNSETSWYVFYTFPRAEKLVKTELEKMNYEVFLPQVRTLRVWKNRQKRLIYQVLFPSYIFVKTFKEDLCKIRQVDKIVTYIHIGGEPSIISDKEIECINKMLDMNHNISTNTSFCEGQKVRIIRGPLKGFQGLLLQQNGKYRFGIQLKDIHQNISIDICTDVLERLQ